MIDIENEVFTRVAAALRDDFSNIAVESMTTYSPSRFPCVCIEETDNYPYTITHDSGGSENHVIVVYEVNIYSNKSTGKKQECKSILSVVDDVMSGMGFTRNAKTPINMDEATKYRIFARYSAVVSKGKIIYRR